LKVLFITATRIGDAVLSSGLLAHLAAENPHVRFTVACGAPAAPLFEAVPGLDQLIVVEKKPFHSHWLSLWSACVANRWDRVYDLRGSMLSRFMLVRERYIAGYRDDSVHRVEELGILIGITPPPAPKLWLSEDARRTAAELIPEGTPVLAIGPTANWSGKQWPADRFAELAERAVGPGGLIEGATVAVLGAPSEREMAQPVLDSLPENRRIDLIGRSLPVAAACIARASLYVGNDSGLMHIAAAMGTPTLGLFGPSPETRYGPWGAHCASVRTDEGYGALMASRRPDDHEDKSLMTGLSVDKAHEALANLYASVKNAF
jgi:ADP-heptose:LPS heptosyltransferase